MTNAQVIAELKKCPPDADCRIDIYKKENGKFVNSEFYRPYEVKFDPEENEVVLNAAD